MLLRICNMVSGIKNDVKIIQFRWIYILKKQSTYKSACILWGHRDLLMHEDIFSFSLCTSKIVKYYMYIVPQWFELSSSRECACICDPIPTYWWNFLVLCTFCIVILSTKWKNLKFPSASDYLVVFSAVCMSTIHT